MASENILTFQSRFNTNRAQSNQGGKKESLSEGFYRSRIFLVEEGGNIFREVSPQGLLKRNFMV